jgi:hypothetical protein
MLITPHPKRKECYEMLHRASDFDILRQRKVSLEENIRLDLTERGWETVD